MSYLYTTRAQYSFVVVIEAAGELAKHTNFPPFFGPLEPWYLHNVVYLPPNIYDNPFLKIKSEIYIGMCHSTPHKLISNLL